MQRQRVALASEVKTVLDSWVRFEQQEKENEQSQLVKSVVDSVLKNIKEEKTQKEVLAWAVSEVEREFFFLPPTFLQFVNDGHRARQEQGGLRL